MTSRPNHFKLGLFVLGGIALLVAALLAFGVRAYFQKRTHFETYVTDDVEGLSIGSPVELRGVRVGKVTHINFSWNEYPQSRPGYVVVEFQIRDNVSPLPPGEEREKMLQDEIKKGLRARVKAQGITGASLLSLEYVNPAIYPPLEVPWTPNYTYIPSVPGKFSQLLTSIENSLRQLEQFEFGTVSRELTATLQSAEKVINRFENVDVVALTDSANALVTDVRETNKKLQHLVDDARSTMKAANLDKLSAEANRLVQELTQTVQKLQPELANLDFAALNETLLRASRAIQTFDETMNRLKEYPSGFIFGGPPPPAKSVKPSTKSEIQNSKSEIRNKSE
jgi:ABC-type transporter Mla subunit MlaD